MREGDGSLRVTSYDVQFQKGLSLREFIEDYGSEDACRDALIRARWPEGFVCPECGSTRHCRLARGLFQCQDCRKQTSPTAGTIFEGTKLPLTVWFQAMHLLTQGKHSVSALELKRQPGVHYETAWMMKQKLLQVMIEREERTTLSGRVEVRRTKPCCMSVRKLAICFQTHQGVWMSGSRFTSPP